MPEKQSMRSKIAPIKHLGRGLCLLLIIPLMAGYLLAQNQPIPNPFATGQAARFVLGQQNFTDITGETSHIHMGATSGIAIAGNKLILADSSYLAPPNNNRVLIYNDLAFIKQRNPQDYLPFPDVVLGQPDFTTGDGGTTAQTFNQPVGVGTDGTRLFVADWGNNRVLIFNKIPETSGIAADVVVGQKDFTSAVFAAGANGLRRPNGVSSDGIHLMIADALNNRVLIYNRIPSANGASADIELGQPNFDANRVLPTAANTLSSPMSATTDGRRLIVTDLGNNRVLIYNTFPSQSGASADVVVGQPDFVSSSAGTSSGSGPDRLDFPRYAYSDGTRLLIVDSGNNRILIYNQIPTQNGVAADVVIGQDDFLGLTESCAASYFAIPFAVASDGDMLFVSDGFNRRVLGFRPGPVMVAQNGVVNGASFSSVPQTQACQVTLRQPPLAPGGIASIFGSNFADSAMQAESLPLPTTLGGIHVRFNGIDAPIFSVSPTQLNVQVPFEVTGYSASMEVEKEITQGSTKRSVVSAAVPVGLANGAPGLFSQDGTGSGPGVIVHSDFTPVTTDSPAKPGETLTAFATGLGTVDQIQAMADGAAAQFGAQGGVTIGGTPGTGQAATIVINGVNYTYTSASGDSLDQVTQGLTDLINADDSSPVAAAADIANEKVNLLAKVLGDSGTAITYNASVPPGGTLTVTLDSPIAVPGNITFFGTPGSGQIVTVTLGGTPYTYTPVASDTIETLLNQLVNIVGADVNVIATADLANSQLHLELRDPTSGLNIPYTVDVEPAGVSLTAATDSPHLTPGVAKVVNTVTATIGKTLPLVPGTIAFFGTPDPGQTVTVSLNSTPYSYTTVPGDSLESVVTKFAAIINGDPNVSATGSATTSTTPTGTTPTGGTTTTTVTTNQISLALKDTKSTAKISFEVVQTGGTALIVVPSSNTNTNSESASVNFAGLVGGNVGLYQVNFTLPTDLTANAATVLTLTQNLIVFGSTTSTNIVSNAVTFPVQP